MNLLFDLDGTLTDPFEGITKSIAHALNQLGRKPPPLEKLQWCIGPPLKQSLATLLETDDDALAQQALVLYRERFGTVGLFENSVYPDIPQVLRRLKHKKHRLFVATAKPTVYAKKIIDHFNLAAYFEKVYGSALSGERADKADLIAYILEKEKIDAGDTVMIGDRKHDMIGAVANRIKGVGVLWGYGTQKELADSGAVLCVGKPDELMSAVGTIGPGAC